MKVVVRLHKRVEKLSYLIDRAKEVGIAHVV